MRKLAILLTMAVLLIQLVYAEDITLPAPQKTGGMSLMEALAKRQTGRRFSDKEIDRQTLSNLLWAAWGVNRENGKRTAPSGLNRQEIAVYVVMKSGVYVYDAIRNLLIEVNTGDHRDKVGMQGFVKNANLSLVYVADYAKMKGDEAGKKEYAAYDTGFISQNVYLYSASAGLSTVVLGSVKRDELRPLLKLIDSQHITLAQPVGYPK